MERENQNMVRIGCLLVMRKSYERKSKKIKGQELVIIFNCY